jgi:hypothetical protein
MHGCLGLKYYAVDEAKAIAECLQNQFTPNDLRDENHEQRGLASVQNLLEAENTEEPEKIRPRVLQKLTSSLKLKEACGIDGIPDEFVRHLQEGH